MTLRWIGRPARPLIDHVPAGRSELIPERFFNVGVFGHTVCPGFCLSKYLML